LERDEERGVVLLGGEATHRDEERPVRASARRLPPEVALGGGRVDPVVDHHRAAAGGGAVAVEGGLGDVDVVVGEAGGSQEAQDGAAGRALEVGEDVVHRHPAGDAGGGGGEGGQNVGVEGVADHRRRPVGPPAPDQ